MTAQVELNDSKTKGVHIPIQIDRRPHIAEKTPMTGAELKALGRVDPAFDLFLVVPGPGDDQLIADDQPIDLKPAMHFISAPRDLNPGG
jgi:hypothetical protein